MIKFRKVWLALTVGLAAVTLLTVTGLAWAHNNNESPPLQPDEDGYIPAAEISNAGFSPFFSYFHAAGTALRPRDSSVTWDNTGSGGCLYQTGGNTLEIFNIHLDIPEGSRIDYLRSYYYDTSTSTSYAWITSYDDVGGLDDITYVSSSGSGGYGTQLSSFISQTLDYQANSYVLNWRSNQTGSTMRLCGLRVAYRLPLKPQNVFLPLVMKGYCGCGPDSYEPNSPCGNAEPLTLPASITSYISCCDVGFGKDGSHDIGYGYDYFSINIGTGGTVNIVLSNIPAGQDYGLYLYEKNCSKLKKSSQRPGNVNETISVSLSSGTYHILVYSGIYGQHSTSPYSLQVTGP